MATKTKFVGQGIQNSSHFVFPIQVHPDTGINSKVSAGLCGGMRSADCLLVTIVLEQLLMRPSSTL